MSFKYTDEKENSLYAWRAFFSILLHENKLFFLFPSYQAIVMHMQKTGLNLQLIANHPVFNLRQSFSAFFVKNEL